MCEKNKNLVNDNEELKLNAAQLEEAKRALHVEIKTLSKENNQMESQLSHLKQQVSNCFTYECFKLDIDIFGVSNVCNFIFLLFSVTVVCVFRQS